MAKKKKTDWVIDDIFLVPLKDGRFCPGQIIGQSMKNTVRIALYDELLAGDTNIVTDNLCLSKDLISLIEVTREQLDFGVWKIIGNKSNDIPVSKQPNEKFRAAGWVGAYFSDAALAEDFLNAYYGLLPWDDWFDPNYLDKFLIDPSKKPKNLILVKS